METQREAMLPFFYGAKVALVFQNRLNLLEL